MTEIDTITIERAAKGDDKAFRKLYDHYAPFVWKVIYRTTNGNKDAAADILQDTFIRLSNSLKKFRHDSALSTWIYRVAFNVAMTQAEKSRNNGARHVPNDVTMELPAAGPTAEDRMIAKEILKSVAPDERFLLVAREVEGIPFEELEIITGKNSGALRTAMHRLKEKIRKEFSNA
jgi:RNA polymerase sigma-70 factor (ECF subfamily)